MRTLRVNLGDRSYNINIGHDLCTVGASWNKPSTCVLIVSDSNVDPLYGDRCESCLADMGSNVSRFIIEAGEESKNLDKVRELYDMALGCGLDRTSTIVALGGGVVGDLAGFAAATYMRGISYVQVPTTLLAMVDSSVGGKTGVNVAQGKNLIGSFYQPDEVVIDLATLNSLPEREYVSGCAEVVKYGVIWDADLFSLLEQNVNKLLLKDTSLLEEVVTRCCEIKAEVVSTDEKESGLRAILNFGHTMAHAVEKVCGYGEFLHGEAVSIGMVYAAGVSSLACGLSIEDSRRIGSLLAEFGLPTDLAGRGKAWHEIRRAMSVDKKSKGSVPRFVLSGSIGSARFGCEVSEDILEEVYRDFS